MKHYFKKNMILLFSTIILTGLIGFELILPCQTAAVVDGTTIENELDESQLNENIPDEGLDEGGLEGEELQEEEPIVIDENMKFAYLTFDDGPSPKVTPQILDILKEYNIKATFFVIGNLAEKHPDILLRIQEEGHLIGNHTYSHNYKEIYSHPQKLMADIEKTEEVFASILGTEYRRSRFVRFPGGSFGEKLRPFRQAVEEMGYTSIDWNVVNGDAEGMHVSPKKQLIRLQETLQDKKEAIILMHDSNTKQTTVDALPDLIEYILSQGYIFNTLEESRF
ncbi:polysaccharide deacetylase family protein [Natronincola ferrireducens]|uniref:Peptidoglycan/xylan/chitin deacetylase, PgdA/CDA1 family n=1 Tax=Natronincola ferrireducens TaxID=393762 RepID=A0A1G9GJD8_9FIRM|nr:polysaccharide deacetylase family protein [Natronincola ferrireducens]SDL00798.1 Peptidoglycan/xylan/chitin deacetylase, PgdA/CDA1 family [Natronincola ferrireducens]